MNELDKEKSNVVTLEDPVEYHMSDVNQSQVLPEIGYTFAVVVWISEFIYSVLQLFLVEKCFPNNTVFKHGFCLLNG